MNEIERFRQEKNSFLLLYIFSYITITFLAVCILFGVYIHYSFNTQMNVGQSITGDYNNQEINR